DVRRPARRGRARRGDHLQPPRRRPAHGGRPRTRLTAQPEGGSAGRRRVADGGGVGADRGAARVVAHQVAADAPVRPGVLHLDAAARVVGDHVVLDVGADGVAGPVAPDADARGGVVLDDVVPERVRRPARVHRPRAAVAGLLAGAGVVLDDVAAGTLFDVDALGAAGVDGVAAHLVGVARVRFRGGVAVELLGRRADVDALTVLALAGVRDREVVDTARADLVVRDEVAGGEVLQP